MRWKWLAYFVTSNIVTVLSAALLLLTAGVVAYGVPEAYHFLAGLSLAPMGTGFFIVLVALVVAGALTSIFSVPFIGMSFTSRVWDHLRSIAWGAESLARGDLAFRLPPSGDQELQSISDSFNQMAARLEKQVNTLQTLAEENARLMGQASEKAVLEERRRLASDLHDAVSQLLFSINMSISAALKMLERKPESAKEQMEFVRDMSLRAQAEMRSLLMHLRPVTLDERGFRQAAHDLLLEVQQKSGIKFDVSLAELEMPKAVEDNLFRILQEAVANSLKHASASLIAVSLSKNSRRFLLSVEDNGVGMGTEPQKQTSYGLKTMEERAQMVGGFREMVVLARKGNPG